jgi:4-hydroxybenzoate polyprenyltransferase
MLPALIGLIRVMRPKQWTKNAIVYAGIVFDGQLFVLQSFLTVTATFALLCLAASSIYIINDIVDIDRDRQHPKKKNRPLPSGQLPLSLAKIAAVALPVATVILSLLLSSWLAVFIVIYLAIHIAYSFRLKHIVILDVLAITAGYVLRVAAGVVVVGVANFSPWLYVSTALLALFLAVGKRRQEYLQLGEKQAEIARPIFKNYNLPLLDDMLRLVMTGILITYTVYTIETDTASVGGTNLALLTVPFVLYGIFRYLYLMHVRGEGSAPDEVLLRDRPLLLSIMLWGLTFVAILYLPGMLNP